MEACFKYIILHRNVYKTIYYRPVLLSGCKIDQEPNKKKRCCRDEVLETSDRCNKNEAELNEQVRKDLQMQLILLEYVEQRQLNWWGHLHRMNANRQVKTVWEAKMRVKRNGAD